MSNTGSAPKVSFSTWFNRSPKFAQGFVDYYDGKPFDYDAGMYYELGWQLAVLAKLDGLRRSDLVRKKPNKPIYGFTSTNMDQLERLANLAGMYGKFSSCMN